MVSGKLLVAEIRSLVKLVGANSGNIEFRDRVFRVIHGDTAMGNDLEWLHFISF